MRGRNRAWVGMVVAAALVAGVTFSRFSVQAQESPDEPTKKEVDAAVQDAAAAQPPAGAPSALPKGSPPAEGAAPAAGAAPETMADDGAPREVAVGIYVNQIRAVSLKDNQFTADFYVWFRWRGDDLEPHKTFELVNGDANKALDTAEVQKLNTGENYVYLRVVGTITQFWDVSRFPLDNHELIIAVEDSKSEESVVKYVPDTTNSGLSPQVTLPGWGKGQTRVEVITHQYTTNYGFTDLETGSASKYSRFRLIIPAERSGYGYFAKLFAGLFVATSIALLVFFIKPTDVDPRFGLGAGAIFAAVASEYVVTSSLPDTNILTMADSLHILAFITIFMTIAESVFSLSLYASGDDDKIALSKKLDRGSFMVMAPAYIIINILLVVLS